MHALLAAIPQPPVNFKAASFQDVFSVAQMVVFGVCLLFAVRRLVRDRSPIFLACLIGGWIAVLWEPIVDVLGQCWLPSRGQHWEAFTLLNRHIPLMMPFVYSWFVGGQGYLFYRIFDRGISRRQLFQLYGLVVLVNIALESPGIAANVYTYYGKQPMNLWGFPLWWGIINPLMPMIAGTAIYKLKPLLTTPQLVLAIIAIIPCADGAANAIVGWPVIAALNTDVGYAGTWVASFVTLGLGLSVAWIVSLLVARPDTVAAPVAEPASARPVSPSIAAPAGV
jgi:hypothetical protein